MRIGGVFVGTLSLELLLLGSGIAEAGLRLKRIGEADLCEIGVAVFQVRHVHAGKERFMKKIRTALVAISTLAIVVLGSGIAQALPRLKPNW